MASQRSAGLQEKRKRKRKSRTEDISDVDSTTSESGADINPEKAKSDITRNKNPEAAKQIQRDVTNDNIKEKRPKLKAKKEKRKQNAQKDEVNGIERKRTAENADNRRLLRFQFSLTARCRGTKHARVSIRPTEDTPDRNVRFHKRQGSWFAVRAWVKRDHPRKQIDGMASRGHVLFPYRSTPHCHTNRLPAIGYAARGRKSDMKPGVSIIHCMIVHWTCQDYGMTGILVHDNQNCELEASPCYAHASASPIAYP